MALAGAFVAVAGDGSVRVERGFVRAEDEPKSKREVAEPDGKRPVKDAEGLAPLSEKLVAELTAYRTSALRNELALNPVTALITLVHALALDTFFKGSEGSCLEITPKSAWLSGHAPGIEESVAEKQIAERHAAWGKRLPDDSEELWSFICGLCDADRVGLAGALRVADRQCGSGSRWPCGSRRPMLPCLGCEIGLDMTAYWQPSAASYFGRVSKERIVSAVREGVSDQAAQKIAGMKKQAMAEAAEAALAGKGWLPSVLR